MWKTFFSKKYEKREEIDFVWKREEIIKNIKMDKMTEILENQWGKPSYRVCSISVFYHSFIILILKHKMKSFFICIMSVLFVSSSALLWLLLRYFITVFRYWHIVTTGCIRTFNSSPYFLKTLRFQIWFIARIKP